LIEFDKGDDDVDNERVEGILVDVDGVVMEGLVVVIVIVVDDDDDDDNDDVFVSGAVVVVNVNVDDDDDVVVVVVVVVGSGKHLFGFSQSHGDKQSVKQL